MKWSNLDSQFRSILRIVAAIMFITSGSMKLFGFPAGPHGGEPVQIMSQMGIGGMLEFFGGFLLLIGFISRPVAFILAGEMAVAYFQFHFPNSPWPTINQGTAAVLYCFIWLYISVAGPGVWSIDAAINAKQKSPKSRESGKDVNFRRQPRVSPRGFERPEGI